MKIAVSVLFVLSSSIAGAKPAEVPECAEVVKKCEAAGYKAGDHKSGGKGLWVDCVAKRSRDKKVEGVDLPAADAQKCLDAVKAQYKGHGH